MVRGGGHAAAARSDVTLWPDSTGGIKQCGRWCWWASCRRRTAPPWRAPGATRRRAPISPPRRITSTSARCWKQGKFQLAFFDDRLAMPDIYGGNPAEVVANGVRVVKLDPVAALLAMGFGTSRLGIGATGSTTYYEPFDLARRFQTVDHMIGGRAAWNVVTSVNDGEAQNMGREVHLAHDLRYDRADEFMEIVLSCWDVVGRRRIGGGQAERAVRQSRQGAPARLSRKVPALAWHVHRAAFAAGPSAGHPGRLQRSRQELRRALGGDGVRRLSGLRARQARIRRIQGRRSRRMGAIRRW